MKFSDLEDGLKIFSTSSGEVFEGSVYSSGSAFQKFPKIYIYAGPLKSFMLMFDSYFWWSADVEERSNFYLTYKEAAEAAIPCLQERIEKKQDDIQFCEMELEGLQKLLRDYTK